MFTLVPPTSRQVKKKKEKGKKTESLNVHKQNKISKCKELNQLFATQTSKESWMGRERSSIVPNETSVQ